MTIEKMRNVLITGAAGNIGSALAKALLDNGSYNVVALDNLSTGMRAKLPAIGPRFRFVKADVNSYEELSAVFHTCRFDYVFHFAAVVGVRRTLENPIAVLRDVDGIRNVLSLSKNAGLKRVFYSSSSEVYGEPVSIPQHEELTPLNSRLPYAIVKNIGEAYVRSYHLEHGLEYTIFRFFNTYGPHQSDDFVVPRFLRLALRNEPIQIYGDGLQTRTFLYVDDNVETMINCLNEGLFVNEVVNIGSDVECTVLGLARLIVRLTRSSSRIVHLPALAEGDMKRRKPDNTKMLGVLKRPLVSLEEGVARLVRFYRENSLE